VVTSKDEKDLGQQILSNGLRTAIIDIDLQFYKGTSTSYAGEARRP